MSSAAKTSSAETLLTSVRAVKKAKKVLRKQNDRSMKIDILAKKVLKKLKKDKSNFDEVKKCIEQDEKFEISEDGKTVCILRGKKRKRTDNISNESDVDTKPKRSCDALEKKFDKKSEGEKGEAADSRVQELEVSYREALAAFKADKANKDLRRAKSAARKAWDAAVAETQDGVQLTCKDCSQSFMFTDAEREFYEDHMSFDSKPTRCKKCNQAYKFRCKNRREQDNKNIKGKNMCWAFQQGNCKHGDKCKFSHNPDFAGKQIRAKC